MSRALAERFIDTLHTLEADRDADVLAALYADGAVAGNTATTRTFDGPEGAREFWTGYRDTFSEIRSEFRSVLADDESAALEWRSTGTLGGGDDVAYEGVTVLEFDGDRITRSTAYFDPRAIVAAGDAAIR